MKCQDDMLNKILQLGLDISQIKDIDLLLEKILGEGRVFTNDKPPRTVGWERLSGTHRPAFTETVARV